MGKKNKKQCRCLDVFTFKSYNLKKIEKYCEDDNLHVLLFCWPKYTSLTENLLSKPGKM